MKEWFEVEIRLYGRSDWRKTTPLVGGIENGFRSKEEAEDFIGKMKHIDDILYEGADWRVVRCTREVLPDLSKVDDLAERMCRLLSCINYDPDVEGGCSVCTDTATRILT